MVCPNCLVANNKQDLLKPCPFCGAKIKIVTSSYGGHGYRLYHDITDDPNEECPIAGHEDEGEMVKTLYSPILWSEVAFESDYDVGVKKISEKEAQITIMAKAFAKSVFISFQDNYKYTFSDNYLDIEAGDSVTITVTADEAIDFDTMVVTDFAEMTK